MRKTWTVYAVALLLLAGIVGCDSQSDKEKLQGNWVLFSMSADGKEQPAPQTGDIPKVSFQGDKFISDPNSPRAEEAAFSVDSDKNPKHLTMTKGKDTQEGIYSLEGDTLKIAFADKARPSGFDGKGILTLTFKREKK